MITFSARYANYIQNVQISHGYIFRTLQHFPTKLRRFTNFEMLFLTVVNDLPRSKFGLLCKLSIKSSTPYAFWIVLEPPIETVPAIDVYRGYYTAVRRYEFYLRVVKTIFYERAQRVSKILFSPREDEIHIFKPPCNVLFII